MQREHLGASPEAVAKPDRLGLLAAMMTLDPRMATARAKAGRRVAAPTVTLTGDCPQSRLLPHPATGFL